MVSRPESQDSVLTPKEALRSPFPGGDTSSSRLPPRDPVARVELPVGDPNRTRGVGESFARILQPCSRGFLHSTTFTGTPLDRASPSTSPRAPRRIT